MRQILAGFDLMFNVIPFLIIAMFILVFVILAITAVKAITRWNQNNHSPVLTVTASVTAKRADITHSTHSQADNTGMTFSSNTTYFTTFEMESGDRMELKVAAAEYGMLAEGDTGSLTFQGTRFLNFKRSHEKENHYV